MRHRILPRLVAPVLLTWLLDVPTLSTSPRPVTIFRRQHQPDQDRARR